LYIPKNIDPFSLCLHLYTVFFIFLSILLPSYFLLRYSFSLLIPFSVVGQEVLKAPRRQVAGQEVLVETRRQVEGQEVLVTPRREIHPAKLNPATGAFSTALISTKAAWRGALWRYVGMQLSPYSGGNYGSRMSKVWDVRGSLDMLIDS
jgi:hypothetical protein